MIGAGLLGSAAIGRWLEAGLRVGVFDTDRTKVEAVAAQGAVAADSPRKIFEDFDVIALALPHSGVSRTVLEQVPAAHHTKIALDMTTGDPEEMAAISAACAPRRIVYCDTTIGGSSAEVAQGKAIVMAGGEETAFESCRRLLEMLATRIFWLGPAGSGARMKLALNLVLGLNRAVLAEGLSFAQRCGLDPNVALDILRSGPAYSRVMDTKGQKMLRGDFEPQARLTQHRKDVDLILQEGARHSAHTPLSQLHRTLLTAVEQSGHGREDNSAIIRAFTTAQ